MQKYYRAIASIIEFNGETFKQPRSDAQFKGVQKMFAADEYYDENFETYCLAWEVAMNPALFEALEEADGAGLSPDDLDRIAKNAGLSHTKKSRSRQRSAKS